MSTPASTDTIEPDEPPQPSVPVAPASCANCGASLVGPYCAACGQKDQPLRQPVHRVVIETAAEVLGIDGRLWRTLAQLLLPGRLTRVYLNGRRTRYVRPLRLYLLATLLFFFLVNVLDPVGSSTGLEPVAAADTTITAAARIAELDSALAERTAAVEAQQAVVDSLRAVLDGADSTAADVLDEAEEDLGSLVWATRSRRARHQTWQRDYLASLPSDSLIQPGSIEVAADFLFPDDDFYVDVGLPAWASGGAALERLRAARTDDERRAAVADLLRSTIRQIPTVMFLLLPLFAFLLKVVYLRRDWYYSEHLVLALHVHAFAFFVFTVVALLILLPVSDVLVVPLYLSVPLYVFLAQKHVYGQGWLKTAVKGAMLGGLYLPALVGGIVFAVLLAAAFG